MPETEANTTDSVETEAAETDATSELGDAGKAAIRKERESRQQLERQLRESKELSDTLAAKVQEFEDRDKSEAQKLTDQIAALQQQLADKDAEVAKATLVATKAEVARVKGVPANRLSGSTKEELEADADAYLTEVAQQRDSKPRKPPVTGLKSGASSSGDTSANPREAAAAALRRMRNGG
ncbi:hypothetical protein [Nocardia rhizosphaerae]|uniref:Scaffolding protein n=1 Tax=Nocardia rhizosphaerae TaxID=1691571 RepID=A0ABV8L2N9_9NOCA